MAHRSPGGQLTSKTGVKSLSKKMQSSRHAFDRQPASSKTAGAFGREERGRHSAHDSSAGTTRKGKMVSLGKMKEKR